MRNRVKVSSIVCGLLFLAAGVLLFSFNAGLLPAEYKHVVFSWPMLLIASGFVFFFSRCKWVGGIILMLIGGFFLLPRLQIEGLEFVSQNAWSIGLIVVGVLVICKTIWSRRFRRHHQCFWPKNEWRHGCHSHSATKSSKTESGYIIRDCVFGNIKETIDVQNFKGGDIDSVFSSVELDLSEAQLAEGVNRLKIDMVFGNIVIYAPIEWNIEIREDSVFGRFVDNRPKPEGAADENKLLIISADSVFGGGEIRCKQG